MAFYKKYLLVCDMLCISYFDVHLNIFGSSLRYIYNVNSCIRCLLRIQVQKLPWAWLATVFWCHSVMLLHLHTIRFCLGFWGLICGKEFETVSDVGLYKDLIFVYVIWTFSACRQAVIPVVVVSEQEDLLNNFGKTREPKPYKSWRKYKTRECYAPLCCCWYR